MNERNEGDDKKIWNELQHDYNLRVYVIGVGWLTSTNQPVYDYPP